ncbi:MAG: hypothetical protein A2287_03435 [Candidatus Melainabacteria bacterium RIFOXYA12_FULL_32_12]|nr:MAG: hypothetical protein A2287_03435 [Candidatus Melainabacteria bacterium RIFOXYA12_FULL_32_12]
MKSKIFKTIKGLKKFSIEDVSLIAEVEAELVSLVINELIEEDMIVKISNNLYIQAEKDKKRKNPINKKGRLSFKNAAKGFMQQAEDKCTSSTFKSYKSAVNKHLIPFFFEFRIADIKPENVDQFIEQKLNEGLSYKSIDNIVKMLGTIFEKALKDRYIPFNPVRAVKRF